MDLDEGFYGSIAAEMNQAGEWIVPTLHGQGWFEKPILIYWALKPSIYAFGVFWGPRIPSILANLATLFLVSTWMKRRFDDSAAKASVLILSSSLLFVALGRMVMTDPYLTLSLTGAFLALFEALQPGSGLRWKILTGACAGLGVLAKGPVALILVGAVAFYLLARPAADERKQLLSFQWLLAIGAAILIVCAWFIPVYLRMPDRFVQEFLIEQNLKRFAGGDEAHNLGSGSLGAKIGNLFAYVPVLFLGAAPWAIPLWRRLRQREKSPAEVFLAAWFLVIFLFFSVSGTKLPHYLMPCLVPVAMLVASGLRGWEERWVKWSPLPTAAIAILGFPVWYQLSGQSEQLDILTHLPKEGSVVCYQLPRREKELGTGQLKIRETALRSTGLYAIPRPWAEVEHLEEAENLPQPLWILTRPGRLSERDTEAWRQKGWRLTRVQDRGGEHYLLYHLERQVSQ